MATVPPMMAEAPHPQQDSSQYSPQADGSHHPYQQFDHPPCHHENRKSNPEDRESKLNRIHDESTCAGKRADFARKTINVCSTYPHACTDTPP